MKKSKEQDRLRLAAITNHPSPLAAKPPKLSNAQKIDYIASRFADIMEAIGLDLNDPSLAKTPQRVARMYVNEIFSGIDMDTFPAITYIDAPQMQSGRANMVFMKVSFHSFCEHHFVPMNGTAYIAYVPHKRLVGLSKIPRIVKYFSSRPQLQERLTAQIADSLAILLEIESVAVSLTAEHFCVMARGIQDTESHATTNVLRGEFHSDDNLRREFFEAINRPRT